MEMGLGSGDIGERERVSGRERERGVGGRVRERGSVGEMKLNSSIRS